MVWKAVHKKSGKICALKRVPIEEDLEDMLSEITIMKSCKSPHIISYFGSYVKENELWIVRYIQIIKKAPMIIIIFITTT